jgi:hypothetical protein
MPSNTFKDPVSRPSVCFRSIKRQLKHIETIGGCIELDHAEKHIRISLHSAFIETHLFICSIIFYLRREAGKLLKLFCF